MINIQKIDENSEENAKINYDNQKSKLSMNDVSTTGIQEIQKYLKFDQPSNIFSGHNTLFGFQSSNHDEIFNLLEQKGDQSLQETDFSKSQAKSPIKMQIQMDTDQDRTDNKLKILQSISRDIQNENNQKNKNISISEIKKIRKNAMQLSISKEVPLDSQRSAKLLIHDLNLLTQKMGAPSQTLLGESSSKVQNNSTNKYENLQMIVENSLDETNPNLESFNFNSKKSINLLNIDVNTQNHQSQRNFQYNKLNKRNIQRKFQPQNRLELLLSNSNNHIKNQNKLLSPIQKKKYVEIYQKQQVDLTTQEHRLNTLVNLIKHKKDPDPFTYQQNYIHQNQKKHQSIQKQDQNQIPKIDVKKIIEPQHKKQSQSQQIMQIIQKEFKKKLNLGEDSDSSNQSAYKIRNFEDEDYIGDLTHRETSPKKKFINKRKSLDASTENSAAQIMDPMIDDKERQRRYQIFKKIQMQRLRSIVKKQKKINRLKNPWNYDSDESCQSLRSEGKPIRMYGKLPKNIVTGKHYQIPSLNQIMDIIKDKQKTVQQIMDILIPSEIGLRDQLSALAIMNDYKLISQDMLQQIKEREDKLSHYVNFIIGNNIYQGGHGALSSDKFLTKGLSRHISKSFSEYVNYVTDNSGKRVANALVSKLKYYQKCKNSNLPKASSELENDPHFNFFNECQHEMDLALPILEKIHNKALNLQNYTLSPVATQALMIASKFFDDFVNKILIDNCGMNDDQFSKILETFIFLKDFKSIAYRRNSFGMKSMISVSKLTQIFKPFRLDELRICNCNITQQSVEELLKNLIEKSFLTKLSLVEANLNDKSLRLLIEFIKNNKYIDTIDISWNNIFPKNFRPFLEYLKDCRKIKSLNLSWNQLVQIPKLSFWDYEKNPKLFIKDQNAKEDPLQAKKQSQPTIKKQQKKTKEQICEELGISESEMFVADCLKKFIKYNSKLLHLNIEGTGLTEYCLKEIAEALRKSRSLISIHLSNNVGLNESIIDHIFQRVHCKVSDFNKLNHIEMVAFEKKMKNQDSAINHKMFQDSIRLSEINSRKRYEQKEFLSGTQNENNTCTLSRYNGFKGEMIQKPGQWQMLQTEHEQCWVCDKWTFTLVFFNASKVYQKQYTASWDNFEDTKEYIRQNLRKFHGSEFVEMNIDENDQKMYSTQYNNVFVDEDESIHLFSNFNNWNPMKMMPFLKYVEVMDKDKPTEEDIISSIKKKQEIKLKERQEKEKQGYSAKDQPEIIQVRQKVQNFKDCNEQEKDLFLREYNLYRMKLKHGKWEEVLQKYLKYKKPAILNLDVKELQKSERLYVLPLFIRDGKQYMMFRYQDLRIETCEWVFQRGILDYRNEEIIHFAKEGSSYTVQRKFAKEKSVFDQWKEDTVETTKGCLEHDYVFWKIQKIKLETEEKRDIEEVLEKYFSFIKHIFLVLASDSEFPAISMVNLSKFIKACNIIDKQTRSDRIDQLYLQACGALDPKDSSNKYMHRWSFLEFIFRLASDRYLDRSKANALEKLIITNFEPNFKLIDIYEPWQEIRDNVFWTLEVDDVIRNNVKGMKQVFNKFSKSKATVSSQDVVAVFINFPKLGINEKQAKFAYGMSKMTVVSEFSANKHYDNMKFVEFLEMICRLAIVKYKGQEQECYDFKDKLQLFLEELLALVGQKFVEVELKDEEISESDQDY